MHVIPRPWHRLDNINWRFLIRVVLAERKGWVEHLSTVIEFVKERDETKRNLDGAWCQCPADVIVLPW